MIKKETYIEIQLSISQREMIEQIFSEKELSIEKRGEKMASENLENGMNLKVTKGNVDFLAKAINKLAHETKMNDELEQLVDWINDCSMILHAADVYELEDE